MILFISVILLISLAISSAFGAGIRLESASYNSVLSLFFVITGNTYVRDFTTNKKIINFTEKNFSLDEAHTIFKSLINTLRGEINKIGDGEFNITAIKITDKKVPAPVKIELIGNEFKRIDFNGKIAFKVLADD